MDGWLLVAVAGVYLIAGRGCGCGCDRLIVLSDGAVVKQV
jgi:hypothetical protein